MEEVFADRQHVARATGAGAVLTLWLRTIRDLLSHGLAERRRVRRQQKGARLMRMFLDDLLTATRALRRRSSFALVAAGMLAVGLGFGTALFAVVQAVLLKPLPYEDVSGIAMLWTGRNPDRTGKVNSWADFVDWQSRSHSLAALAAYNIAMATMTDNGEPEEIGGAVVSPGFFAILRPRLELGRGIAPGDEQVPLTSGRPVVISHRLWVTRFGHDPDILSRTVVLNERRRPIIGVMGEDFVQPEPFWEEPTDFWLPLPVDDSMRTNHANTFLRVIARLAPDVTITAAAEEMDRIGRDLQNEFPSPGKQSVVMAPIALELAGDTRPMLWLFLGAVTLVLCLAVANVANLTFATMSARRGELALRAALGADRARLASLVIAESIVIGLAGGLAGLIVARGGIALLLRFGPSSAPHLVDTAIDLRTVGWAIGVSALTGAICGVVPAWRMTRERVAGSGMEMRGTAGVEASRARMWLVAAEMALAVPLLVGAGLLTLTLVRMQHVDPGFDPAHALQFRLSLAGARYDTDQAKIAFFREVGQRLGALPGAEATGIVSSLPLGGLNNTGGSIVAETVPQAQLTVGFRMASANYFRAIGLPMKRGRTFADSPADANTVIINERTAQALWPDTDPIGRRLRFGMLDRPDKQGPWLTVVGVVGDVRHEALTREGVPEMFQPYSDNTWSTMMVVVRSGDPSALIAPVRTAMHALDPRLPLVDLAPASDFIRQQLALPKFGVLCAAVFAAVGLVLAASGTFAVLSLLVSQRAREIGIRMALGATPRRVGSLLARESLAPVALGCIVGALAAAFLSRLLTTLLYGVAPLDRGVFAVVILTLLSTAFLAAWWPTRRAMRVDPIRALRAD